MNFTDQPSSSSGISPPPPLPLRPIHPSPSSPCAETAPRTTDDYASCKSIFITK